jgi:CheY-like chemotaxis protein
MNPNSHTDTSQPVRAGGRILVVDDEYHVLAVAKAILESHGFCVHGCSSGEEAIEAIRDCDSTGNQFSVVVLDLTLPGGMSGFEVLETIQSLDPDIHVIACSGYFQEDARDLCQAIGFTDILQKPYALEDLCATVRRCLVKERQPSLVAA